MICSSEPSGMIRASTPSASRMAALSLERPPATRCPEPSRATSPSYGSTGRVCWRSARARHSWSVCQPVRALNIATCIGRQSSALEERREQHVRVEPPGVKRPPARRAAEADLGGAEEHRVDLIEVVIVALEDVVEGRAVVGGSGRRKTLGELGKLVVLRPHGGAGLD